jgi:hypothetical protein
MSRTSRGVFLLGEFVMRSNVLASAVEVETDVVQIEQAFRRIEDPHMRYWIAHLVELIADGVELNITNAEVLDRAYKARKRAGDKDAHSAELNQSRED